MSSIDLILMTIRNLFSRKTRTFLTVIGVVIGTSSIVIMVSIGIGMNESFKDELSRMGSLNIINVRQGFDGMYGPGGSKGGGQKQLDLDDKAVASFSKLPGVKAVIPFIETSGKLVSGKYVSYVQLQGIGPDMLEELGLKVAQGRLLQNGDTMSMVFGSEIQNSFYNPKSSYGYMSGPPKIDLMKDKLSLSLDMSYGESYPGNDGTGQTKKPVTYVIKPAGILEGGGYEYAYNVFMPIDHLKKLIKDFNKGKKPNEMLNIKGYSKILVKVEKINDVQNVQKQIKDAGYQADSLTDILESMQKTAAGIQMVLGAIGAVSLLVASIGITNTMIMSIYERTREIGIMKVIGASIKDIKRLFLFESGMIGFFGGIIGLGFSYGVSYILNSSGFALINFYGPEGGPSKTSIIPMWLALGALIFTTLIGLISGYYPARRAMKLSALEAMKE